MLGAPGLLVGYAGPLPTFVASGGLMLLMVLGLATRCRIRDSPVDMLPALLLMRVTLYIFVYASQLLPSP